MKLFKTPDIKHEVNYIFTSPFLTEEFCTYIVNKCNKLNTWGSESDDKDYFTQDIYFKEELPDLYDVIETGLKSLLFPTLSELMYTEIPDPHQIFAIKYAEGLQTFLPLHRDESYISASIKLNNDYEGGVLTFPEEAFSNKDMGVGEIVVFPASITHPHFCSRLTKGEKYSLTIWTDYPKIDKSLVNVGHRRQK
tara:strand:- start:485 stop:1066 length:582 start_codon:yes stop_codon:yes gene_type:complete